VLIVSLNPDQQEVPIFGFYRKHQREAYSSYAAAIDAMQKNKGRCLSFRSIQTGKKCRFLDFIACIRERRIHHTPQRLMRCEKPKGRCLSPV